MVLRLFRYRTCRRIALIIVVLFFINLFIITQLVDLQNAWKIFTKKPDSSYGFGTNDQETNEVIMPECAFNEPLTRSVVARMQTEVCRLRAMNITCNEEREIPDDLPNSCPHYHANLRGTYVGCFTDTQSFRVLDGHHYKFRKNTPTHCINMCFRASYRYAGVEFQNECFCGDTVRNASVTHDSYCRQYLCSDSSALYCGGHEAIAVYSTGIDVTEKTVSVASYDEPNTAEANVHVLFLLQFNGRDIRQITRLLRLIYSSKHYYVIHVDIRQRYLFEEITKVGSLIRSAGFNNVHILEERYATIWAGNSLLDMVLNALNVTLYRVGWADWDFMLNLSESDFPVLSLAELEFHLARNKGRNFLSSHGYDTARFLQKQGLDYIFMQCENRMWRLAKRKKYFENIRLDGGSDWVVISREFAEFALSNQELPRGLRLFFSSVLLPVESFFHTTAKYKAVFFGRKFDPMISQTAIAAAEKQSLRYTSTMLFADHPSNSSTWINVYSNQVDNSDLLRSFAKSLYRFRRTCAFDDLVAIYAYRESDETKLLTVFELVFICENDSVHVQILVEPKEKVTLKNDLVDGYSLSKIEVGADFDYKEEVFRKYHKIFSEEDALFVKMSWQKIQKSSQLSTSHTSPTIAVEWKNGNQMVKRTLVQPYDSIYGGQFSELYANESKPGEWSVQVMAFANDTDYSVDLLIASVEFIIFSANNVSESVISNYYKVLDTCSERGVRQMRPCKRTSWSSYYPDPKSQLFL